MPLWGSELFYCIVQYFSFYLLNLCFGAIVSNDFFSGDNV